MKIYVESDAEVDALYLGFQEKPLAQGSVTRTVRVTQNIFVDLDSEDRLAGVEIIGASKYVQGNPAEFELDSLIGVKEAAALLGVAKSNFLRDYAAKPDFPKPIAEIASGRIWLKTQVEKYASRRPRKRAASTGTQNPGLEAAQ